MTLNPHDDTAKKTRRHIAAQRRFAASAANVPGGVSAQDAACNGTGGQQPWIAAMRHQPQQQQVGAAGQRQRDDRGIDHRNREEPQRSQVREPVRHQRGMHGVARAM